MVSPSRSPSRDDATLRLHGSNTIGKDLAPALAVAFLKAEGAESASYIPSGVADEGTVVAKGGNIKSIGIQAHGSATGFTDLNAGSADVAMASRAVKPSERADLLRFGDMRSGANEHVLGLDGIAVIVHAGNPVDHLSRGQLRDIFAGRITDWSQVGGRSQSINLYARDDKSGTFDTFKALVLDPNPIAPGARRFGDSQELSEAVARDPDGIGFIGLPFVDGNQALLVSDAGTRPIAPTFFTVAREEYPLSRRLFLYTASAPANVLVNRFVQFALSKAGQDIVKENGFASQNIVAELPSPRDEQFFGDRVAGAKELNVVFRFKPNSSELDNKAQRDLLRLLDYAKSQSSTPRIMLFGFADSNGSAAASLKLSKDRAHEVAAHLGDNGLYPSYTEGFGQANPVADNATREGQESNRRVEVWVR